MRRLSRPPNRSPKIPENMAPMTVPASAMKTVTPNSKAERWKTPVSCCVVPAMTAVSKPKSSPPRAPTMMLLMSRKLSLVFKSPFAIRCSPERLLAPHRQLVAVRVGEVEALAAWELEGLAHDLSAHFFHLAVHIIQGSCIDHDQHAAGLRTAVRASGLRLAIEAAA